MSLRPPSSASRRRGASKTATPRPAPAGPGPGDSALMGLALEAAERGLGRTSPNPAVGAVIARGGRVLAVGHHVAAGQDHAEVAALRQLDARAEGCTLYSTLEPCDHQGRTGSCTEAILAAGITRVVIGAHDPNPLVSGRGVRRLRKAGVEVVTGVLGEACERLNEAFNFAIVHKRPFVVLKAATSLDGRIATRGGESKWITSEEARRAGHLLRDRLDAICVGVNTVLADDPELTARLPDTRNPVRVVLDSRLRTPPSSKLVRSAREVRTLIATTREADLERRRLLESRGVEVLVVKRTREGRVDLGRLLEALAERELNSVLVEGGGSVLGAFVDAKLVNKVVLFLAPMIIGGEGAPHAVGGRGVKRLGEALRLERLETERVGPDLMIVGYPRLDGA